MQVPGAAENSQAILDTLSSQGVLEFVDVSTITDETVRNYINQGLTGMNLKKEGVSYTPFMTGENVENVTVDRPQASAEYAVNLQLDATGTSEFASVTRQLVSTNGQDRDLARRRRRVGPGGPVCHHQWPGADYR